MPAMPIALRRTSQGVDALLDEPLQDRCWRWPHMVLLFGAVHNYTLQLPARKRKELVR